MKFKLYQGDCLERLKQLEGVQCIFADPPDNIGLGYDEYDDKLAEDSYRKLLHDWTLQFMRTASIVWISFNARWTFAMGQCFDSLLSAFPDWEGKACTQVFTFGQHNKNDLGNNHRPLWRLKHKDAPLYPDAIKVPSDRQRLGDKRAKAGGRVPGDVLDCERWAPIPPLSGDDIDRFFRHISRVDAKTCWEWIGSKHGGYGRISLGGKNFLAHRVMWKISHGYDPAEMSVCHSCDNPACCNTNHLWLGTHTDNMRDMTQKGRNGAPAGELHHNAKLTPDDVFLIRSSFASLSILAEQFHTTVANISAIKSGKAWVDGPWPKPTDVFDFPRVTGNSKQRCDWHPTQLHEELVERCIKLSTVEGDSVLDPFGGTGTTLRVCERLPRSCTLIELDEGYCRKIAEASSLKVCRSPGTWGK